MTIPYWARLWIHKMIHLSYLFFDISFDLFGVIPVGSSAPAGMLLLLCCQSALSSQVNTSSAPAGMLLLQCCQSTLISQVRRKCPSLRPLMPSLWKVESNALRGSLQALLLESNLLITSYSRLGNVLRKYEGVPLRFAFKPATRASLYFNIYWY